MQKLVNVSCRWPADHGCRVQPSDHVRVLHGHHRRVYRHARIWARSCNARFAGTDLGKNFVLGICLSLMALTFDLTILKWSSERKKMLGLEE